MKKNFLFGLLALMLAGFGFGGVSIACETSSTRTEDHVAGYNNQYYCTLGDAILAAGEDGTITLLKDISLNAKLDISKKVNLDLNSQKITIGTNECINSNAGGDLTITNGSIESTSFSDWINANGGNITLGEGLTLSNDNGNSIIWVQKNSTVTVDGATISSKGTKNKPESLAFVSGAGSKMFINEGSSISSEVASVTISVKNGGNVEINGGTVTSSATNAIASQSNSIVTIKGGTVSTTAPHGDYYWMAGFTATNGQIIVEGGEISASDGYGLAATNNSSITIKGGTVNNGVVAHEGDTALITIQDNAIINGPVTAGSTNATDYQSKGKIIINGGNINGTVSTANENGKIEINGGIFSKLPTSDYTVPEGKMLALNSDSKYELVDAVTVTLVNGNETQGTITMPKNGTLTQEGIGSTLTAEGKVFMGWYYADGTKFPETETTVSEDITLTAKWGHTVKFLKESEDTSAIKELIVEENTNIKAEEIPENPTKEGYKFKEWTVGGASANVSTYNIDVDVTFVASWTELISASTSSIKAANIPSDDREKRNLDKFTVSNSYDASSKTLTVTITDNGMEAYVGGNSQTAKKWLGLIADFGAIVNGSEAVEGIEKYTIGSDNEAENNIDRTDANIYGGDENSETDFIIWITREDKDGKTIRFINAAAEDDYVNVKFVFKDKQTTPSYSGGGGSSRSSSKTTTTDDTKKVEDTSKTDETKVDEQKTDETKADETKTSEEAKAAADAQALKDGYSQEFIDAYNFARKNNITTKDTIREADMDAPLTRIAMAKMLSQYAINVLGKTPDTSIVVPTFPDVDAKLDADYNNGVTLAYQLGIMGIGINKYRPFDLVTRAEFGTALSRMLFGLEDGEGNEWYSTHLAKLMEEKIITNNNPNLQELRGYVMIMLMRSAQ